MKCPLTGNECQNPKTFSINEIVDGKKKSLDLCHQCAAQYLTNPAVQKEFLTHQEDRKQKISELKEMMEQVSEKSSEPPTPAQMLKNLINKMSKTEPKVEAAPKKEPACPGCNSTASDIAKSKKLGCMQCFDFFGKSILVVLNKIHGNTTHVGKVPKRWMMEQAKAEAKKEALARKKVPVEETIADLENMLKAAVRSEDYDKAAQIRDQLNAIKPLQEQRLKLNEELKTACSAEDLDQVAILKQQIIETMKQINQHR
jgi:protein-arginine kinase activator protein McsA